MPNIGYITIDPDNSWKADLGEAANSKRLWLNSLVSAHASLEVATKTDEDSTRTMKAETAGRILKSYLDKHLHESTTFQGAWQDEHAVANRLFVIIAFLHASCGGADPSIYTTLSKYVPILRLLFEADKHAQWLNDDKHYIENNHGTMMDLALAQFAVFLKVIDPVTSDRYLATALRRLEKMLDSTFDDDGCCTENSPTYHFVNYGLFSTIEQFIQHYRLGNTDKWGAKLAKARYVGHLLLRPDGTIPLVGDSEIRPGTFFPKIEDESSIGGIGYYPSAGIFVASINNLHLTFRAGGSKFTHRHVDDLSFTLWVQGKEFIIDSGMYNYDTSDKLRRWFISSRAHSGIYLESAGHILFKNFESPMAMSEFTSERHDSEFFNIKAVHKLSKIEVNRELEYQCNTLTITDHFQSHQTEQWRVQFVLHPDVVISQVDQLANSLILRNGSTQIGLREINGRGKLEIEHTRYSPTFMKEIENRTICFHGEDTSVRLAFEITIGAPHGKT